MWFAQGGKPKKVQEKIKKQGNQLVSSTFDKRNPALLWAKRNWLADLPK
jgi:hypothetical protein